MTSTDGNIVARFGMRRFAQSGRTLVPFVGGGTSGNYSKFSDSRQWSAGLYGEAGASYRFTPHLSLGAVGEMNASYAQRRLGGDFFRERTIGVSVSAVRVLGTVYF